MAVKRDPPQEEPNFEDTEEASVEVEDASVEVEDASVEVEDASVEVDELPTKEEVENLEQKIAVNIKELDNIADALAHSMLISVIMEAYSAPNSEIQEKINVSNQAIVTCFNEAVQIGAVLNYIKEELKQFK